MIQGLERGASKIDIFLASMQYVGSLCIKIVVIPLPHPPPLRLNFGLAAAALGHVVMLGPLALGHGGPLAPVLLATWALTSE